MSRRSLQPLSSRIGAGLVALSAAPGLAGDARPASADLTELSLVELMSLEVTLATRTEQPLFETAAALYVLTREDIRRSGATSVPEALRMVPGLHVARVGSSKWAVSARGFTDLYANKLLVLIDGRSVYTPLFAGVDWDSQDVLLEDVERIEVIRGPGATLWGANAVNGVINIVTRSARDTEGQVVSLGAGDEERGLGGARVGGSLGADASYRVWAKYANRDAQVDRFGEVAGDGWDVWRGGLRVDWQVSPSDQLTLLGDVYDGEIGERMALATLAPPYVASSTRRYAIRGRDALVRWDHAFGGRSDAQLQLYYDRTERGDYSEQRDTFDLELQHSLGVGSHDVVWGVGYRNTRGENIETDLFSFEPSRRSDDLFSAFVQGELAGPGSLRAILGTKLEHNDYTGFELQPSVRLVLAPSKRHTVWAAVSRALRTPSRGDHDIRYTQAVEPGPDGVLSLVTLVGDRAFGAEELMAYELGYRTQPTPRVALELAAFYNDYDDLRTLEPGEPYTVQALGQTVRLVPQLVANGASGTAWGFEAAAKWDATERWRLAASYSGLSLDVDPSPASRDPRADFAAGESPRHQLHLRSFLDLSAELELDASLYHYAALPSPGVSSFTRVDVMLGWHPTPAVELRVALQNALDSQHAEFRQSLGVKHAIEIQRSAWARLTWRF